MDSDSETANIAAEMKSRTVTDKNMPLMYIVVLIICIYVSCFVSLYLCLFFCTISSLREFNVLCHVLVCDVIMSVGDTLCGCVRTMLRRL